MRREMIKGRQGSWGQGGSGNREPHLRGVYIQWKQVFLGYAAWIFIMPLYSSLLNFNHFTHIRQTTSWCQKSVRAAGSPVARQNSKGGSFTGRRTRERHQTNSKLPFSQIQHLFVTFHFKTHTFPDRIKAQLKQLNVPACRLQILFQSLNASFHWGGGVISAEEDDWFLVT